MLSGVCSSLPALTLYLGTSVDAGVWINVECNIGIVSACLPLLRPLFNQQYPSSPASHFARFFRSFASYNATKGSRDSIAKEKECPSSDGTFVTKPRAVYIPPANSDVSESTLDIGPEPPPKDEKYMTWGSSPACDFGGFERSTFETMREDDLEKQSPRTTFESSREDEHSGSEREASWGWGSC